MLGTTTSNNDTSTMPDLGQSLSPCQSKDRLCTSCQIPLGDVHELRKHAKSSWQYVKSDYAPKGIVICSQLSSVYNLKRRIASLPTLTLRDFERLDFEQSRSNINLVDADQAGNAEESLSEDEEDASPFMCLFCSQGFANDHSGLDDNIEHMKTTHGFFMPDMEKLVDVQTFVAYLATEVRIWHECLYCGATKTSVSSIQSHMRDKQHCQLNFEREPELLEFWDVEDTLTSKTHIMHGIEEQNANISGMEMFLPSGKIITSKDHAQAGRHVHRRHKPADSSSHSLLAAPDDSQVEQSSLSQPLPTNRERQIGRRDEMSILGISTQQRQAIVLAEKKAQRSEAIARRAREWVRAKGANSQKFDQLDNKMKWGKQQHKLLPR